MKKKQKFAAFCIAPLLSVLYGAALLFLPYYKLVEINVNLGFGSDNHEPYRTLGRYTLLTLPKEWLPGILLLQIVLAVLLLIAGLLTLIYRKNLMLRIFCVISAAAGLLNFKEIAHDAVYTYSWQHYESDTGMYAAAWCAGLILILTSVSLLRDQKQPDAPPAGTEE